MTPRDVLDKLIDKANLTTMIADPHYRRIEREREAGKISDVCMPGALLKELTAEELEVLKGLTSDMTRNERHWSL